MSMSAAADAAVVAGRSWCSTRCMCRYAAPVACPLMKMKRFNEGLTSTHLSLDVINLLSPGSDVTYA